MKNKSLTSVFYINHPFKCDDQTTRAKVFTLTESAGMAIDGFFGWLII